MNDLQSGQELDAVAAASPQDLARESELVHLVSTLEAFRAQLHDDYLARRSLPAVETMLAMAKGVDGFVRSRFGDGADEAHTTAQASASAFFAAARALYDRLDDDVFKALWRLLRRPRYECDPKEQFADAARKLRAYLNDAFALCAGRFVSASARHSWTETYAVFLQDMDVPIQTPE